MEIDSAIMLFFYQKLFTILSDPRLIADARKGYCGTQTNLSRCSGQATFKFEDWEEGKAIEFTSSFAEAWTQTLLQFSYEEVESLNAHRDYIIDNYLKQLISNTNDMGVIKESLQQEIQKMEKQKTRQHFAFFTGVAAVSVLAIATTAYLVMTKE